MSESRLSDCVGSDCKYYEFEVIDPTPKTYSYKDPTSGRWYRERFPETKPPPAKEAGKETAAKESAGETPDGKVRYLTDAFTAALKKLYADYKSPHGEGCEKDCVCEKTGKAVEGPTNLDATKEHTHIIDDSKSKYDGYEVEGTYKLKVTVYKGVCVPAKTRTGKAPPEKKEPERRVCCWPDDYDYYYRCYVRYRPYWYCYGPYRSYRRR